MRTMGEGGGDEGRKRRELARARMREIFPAVAGAFASAKLSHPEASIRLAVSAYSRAGAMRVDRTKKHFSASASQNLACFQAAAFLADLLELVEDEGLEQRYGESLKRAATEDAAAGEG
jgi:hypothetical protein